MKIPSKLVLDSHRTRRKSEESKSDMCPNEGKGLPHPIAPRDRIFFDVREAALKLDVKVGWLYERTRRNLIPHHKLGKFVRFTEQDLKEIEAATATGSINERN